MLSEREITIIGYIREGDTNEEIAKKIGVKTTTIGQYIHTLMRMYNAKNRIDLVNKVTRKRG